MGEGGGGFLDRFRRKPKIEIIFDQNSDEYKSLQAAGFSDSEIASMLNTVEQQVGDLDTESDAASITSSGRREGQTWTALKSLEGLSSKDILKMKKNGASDDDILSLYFKVNAEASRTEVDSANPTRKFIPSDQKKALNTLNSLAQPILSKRSQDNNDY